MIVMIILMIINNDKDVDKDASNNDFDKMKIMISIVS